LALEHHFKEEFGHGEMFLAGLTECGIGIDQMNTSMPLRTTQALVDYMTVLGCEDSIA